MPELPEVETYRRRIAAKALRRRIDAVGVQAPRILGKLSARDFSARLVGRELRDARRYGKRLYCALDRDGAVAMHFGLTGDVVSYRDSEPQPKFARVVLDFSDGSRLAYVNRRMFGRVELVDDMAHDVRAKKLGPDALDPKLTPPKFRQALAERRCAIKSVLMDQAVIAGIGNEYSDEILFQAGIHPQTPASALGRRELDKLFRTTKQVLERAIAAGAEHERFPKRFLIPHRRAGEKCPRCDGKVRRLTVGGRSAYFCPRCQVRAR